MLSINFISLQYWVRLSRMGNLKQEENQLVQSNIEFLTKELTSELSTQNKSKQEAIQILSEARLVNGW